MQPLAFWTLSSTDALKSTGSRPEGLNDAEVGDRRARYGANLLTPKKKSSVFTLLLGQFKSPIILILVFAAVLAFALQDATEATIILVIVLASGLLGFWQEHGAADAVEKLLAMVQIKATVRRSGVSVDIPLEDTVPGDVVVLNAGDVVPGDCLVLESKDLFLDEAALTGETYPVEKSVGVLPESTPLAQRTNSLWMGTHVVSGDAIALVVNTGKSTEFGKVSERLAVRAGETEFERGVRRFGYLLLHVTLMLVIAVFAINVFFQRSVLDSFLFSLALAVGLTPQLLPAIISVNLAHGARRMADAKVIVKRLASIENFGSMNILCSDKTGTLTEGVVTLDSALGLDGRQSEKVLLYACLNASFETGFANPIDEALRTQKASGVDSYRKLDEVPYDFIRKRLSILVGGNGKAIMVTKGALPNVLAVCTEAQTTDTEKVPMQKVQETIQKQFSEFSAKGCRTLGVAIKDMGGKEKISKGEESGMVFLGFLLFTDPPKAGIAATLTNLKSLGVSVKIITGDNELVAQNISQQVGIAVPEILSGDDLQGLSDEALRVLAQDVDVFAAVEPNQKERIILALRKSGNVVGYMGDGINDASALHAADVGLSVDSAVDVAKEAADIVLLEKDLNVLAEGIKEGRRTFGNTLKYVLMATSANFGNMFSMAGASLFLPFLPLLPEQILLTNLMTDFPEMTIASDAVDVELIERPRRWDIAFIRRFMVTFGLLSSVFDYLTFGILLLVLHAGMVEFRTGWFLESVVSASLIVLIVRSRRPLLRSTPGKYLLWATIAVAAVTLVLPYTPLAGPFGFAPLPPLFLVVLGVIVLLYCVAAEAMKSYFYRRVDL